MWKGCHQMHIFNTVVKYLFWFTINKKDKYQEFCMGDSDKTISMIEGSWGHTSVTHQVCHHRMCTYLIPHLYICYDWLIKGKYQEFCLSYSDETWYIGSAGYKYYPCVCRHRMCLFNKYLISVTAKKGKLQSTFLAFPQRFPTFCEHSECISWESQNSTWCWIEEKQNKTKQNLWPFHVNMENALDINDSIL